MHVVPTLVPLNMLFSSVETVKGQHDVAAYHKFEIRNFAQHKLLLSSAEYRKKIISHQQVPPILFTYQLM